MDKPKEKPTDEEDEKETKAVMVECCNGDEVESLLPEKLKERVLLKLGTKLGDRSNVVMTRLDDDDVKQIDALVEVEAFNSRSEAAAFFIKQGIRARRDLFEKVMSTVEKIRELKEQAKRELSNKESS